MTCFPTSAAPKHQERGEDALHGVGGPLAVSDVCEPHPLCEAFIAAAQQAGFPRNDDFNGATQEGAGYFQLTTKNGRRWSTAVGYLRPARAPAQSRASCPSALASRILFEGRRAVGVEYRQGGTTRTARASGEVILAGGAFNSPQLLQLSGLGPAELLRAHRHRGDRRHAGRRRRPAGPPSGPHALSLHRADHDERRDQQLAPSDRRRTALRAVQARAARRSAPAMPAASSAPSPQRRDARRAGALHHLQRRRGRARRCIPFPGFIASICQLRPESRGFVRIKSADPRRPPAIQPRYLSARSIATRWWPA